MDCVNDLIGLRPMIGTMTMCACSTLRTGGVSLPPYDNMGRMWAMMRYWWNKIDVSFVNKLNYLKCHYG